MKKPIEQNRDEIIRKAIRTIPPEQIANGTRRAESDHATPEELRLYRKGAESMLRNFADGEYVEEVMNAFDMIYKEEK